MTMQSSVTRAIGIAAISVALGSGEPLTFAFAHEGHQTECNEGSINAMKADIQSMPDGKTKTTAIKEMQAAQDMLRKKDTKGCMAHMHTAMEAMEKKLRSGGQALVAFPSPALSAELGGGMVGSSGSHTKNRQWPVLVTAIIVIMAVACLSAVSTFVYMGAFDVSADTPHSQPVYWLMQTVREYSIGARARDAVPNDLSDAKRITSGAGQYAEMCAVCHLAPGMQRTEISRGLYPRAPELRRGSSLTPAEEFWVVKHGIKMTGMPAWGLTHNDEILWDVVAFVRKLPELTAEQYQALVKDAPKTHDEMMHKHEPGHELRQ